MKPLHAITAKYIPANGLIPAKICLTDAYKGKLYFLIDKKITTQEQAEIILKKLGFKIKGVTHIEGFLFVILVKEFEKIGIRGQNEQ